MNPRHAFKGCLAAALVTFGASFGLDNTASAQRVRADVDTGVQVLTRGPIHAAFAETVTFDPQAGIVVPKAPPGAIEELPPDQRPEGNNVAWIPGYWAWDDDRDDFLWISGIWRALPPGRQWVPGYWGQSGQGNQWTSGYWADAELNEVRYLPEPPATVEAGPNIAAPSENHIWAPGCWMWNQNRYAWRPGYWVPAQQNWVWIPSHYHWSPRGYVFVDGYYDYSVARRGVLFAPVYFNPSVYAQRGFTYSPAMAISLAVFGNQLFLRPNYNHYYFGDYYGSNYSSGGFYPWFSFNSGGYGYDPFYAQQRWQNRQNAAWSQTVQADFQNRVDNEGARPPRTLLAQQALIKSGVASSETSLVVATSLDQHAKNKESLLRFQSVTKQEQQALAKQGQDVRQFGEARQKLEAKGAVTAAADPSKTSEPVQVKLPASPIVAKPAETLGKDLALPKTQDAPKLDLKVESKPRIAREPNATPKVTKVDPVLPKVETKPDVPQTGPKDTPKVEPKPALPKVEAKPVVPKVGPKDVPTAEPKPALPKVEPKDTPKAEPKPVLPKVEPKPVPKVDPKPAPKVEPQPERPKVEPKVEPKQVPKVDPKPAPAPRVDPKPGPKVDPKPEAPKPEPKVEPKDKPKK